MSDMFRVLTEFKGWITSITTTLRPHFYCRGCHMLHLIPKPSASKGYIFLYIAKPTSDGLLISRNMQRPRQQKTVQIRLLLTVPLFICLCMDHKGCLRPKSVYNLIGIILSGPNPGPHPKLIRSTGPMSVPDQFCTTLFLLPTHTYT